MSKPWIIVGLGEVLWDIFPDGAKFGGAAANFACSAAALAGDRAKAFMASSVGDDELGRKAIAALRDHQVDTTCVQVSSYPTGSVTITTDQSGNASYSFASNTAWDNLQWTEALQELAARVDAVCFGTLGQRSEPSRKVVEQFLKVTRRDALRIFDINVRRPFFTDDAVLRSLERANVLKLNEDELPVVADLCQLTGSPVEQLNQLAHRYDLACVALTRGPDGALLIRGGEVSETPAAKMEVVDTVGAGDAFTATLALGLLLKAPLNNINDHASRVAGYVCSQTGATPSIPDELKLTSGRQADSIL